MARSPFNRTRFFVLMWLIAGLVMLAWYLGDQTAVAGGRVMVQTPPKVGNTTLVGPYWRAIELAGKPVSTQDAKREAHLVFQAGGRLSGSDGCNQFTGSYELKGDAFAFGQLAGTQMACINIGNTDQAFRDALKRATRVTRGCRSFTVLRRGRHASSCLRCPPAVFSADHVVRI
jgi:heat shock protein HslJ